MAWNDADELVVAKNGQVYVAPIGTPLPTDPDEALNAAFIGLGYVTEDGATLTVSPEVTDFMAWQSRQPIRRELTAQEIQVSFGLQQWNEETVPLAFGGGQITTLGGGAGYRYDFPEDSDSLDERALVLDAQDGAVHHRFVFPRGNVTEAVETQFQRGATAVLPVTFKALEPTEGGRPGYYLTDSPDFAAGS